MKKYINKITGIAIETPCDIVGENWVKIELTAEKASGKKEKSTAKASEKKEVAVVSETKVVEATPNET